MTTASVRLSLELEDCLVEFEWHPAEPDVGIMSAGAHINAVCYGGVDLLPLLTDEEVANVEAQLHEQREDARDEYLAELASERAQGG